MVAFLDQIYLVIDKEKLFSTVPYSGKLTCWNLQFFQSVIRLRVDLIFLEVVWIKETAAALDLLGSADRIASEVSRSDFFRWSFFGATWSILYFPEK